VCCTCGPFTEADAATCAGVTPRALSSGVMKTAFVSPLALCVFGGRPPGAAAISGASGAGGVFPGGVAIGSSSFWL